MTNPFESIEEKLSVIAADVRHLLQRNEEPPSPDVGGMELAEEVTQLSARTIYKKTSLRQIPHIKVNGRLYFKRSELEAWIEAGRRPTAKELALELMTGNKK